MWRSEKLQPNVSLVLRKQLQHQSVMTKRKYLDFSNFLEWLQQFVSRRGQRTVAAAHACSRAQPACNSKGILRVWCHPWRVTTSSVPVDNQKLCLAESSKWTELRSFKAYLSAGLSLFYFKLLVSPWCFGVSFCAWWIMRSKCFHQEGFEGYRELRLVSCSMDS